MWLLTRLSSCELLNNSLPSVSRSLPSVPCHGGLSIEQFTAWQLALEPEGQSLPARKTLQSNIMWLWEWHHIAFAIFCCLEPSYRPCPRSRGGDHSRVWIPGGRVTGDHLCHSIDQSRWESAPQFVTNRLQIAWEPRLTHWILIISVFVYVIALCLFLSPVHFCCASLVFRSSHATDATGQLKTSARNVFNPL